MNLIKSFLSELFILLISSHAISQQLKLGKNPSSVEVSAVLELQSDNQGLLLPRLTDTTLINRLNVPDGMMIFHVPTLQLMLRSGSNWKPLRTLSGFDNYWSNSGNRGSFQGTTDLKSFTMGTNNIQSLNFDSVGSIGVGINPLFTSGTNREKFLVDAGTTNSYNVISGKGRIDNYLQLSIQNRSNGTHASSDVVASANNSSETVNFIDLGINSSGFSNTTYPVINGINNAYLFSTGNDLVIGNATPGKNLRFFTGGYAINQERLRIDASGNVGIGTSSIIDKLTIAGNVLPSTTGIYNIGSPSYRWNYMYTSNLIQVSDIRLKSDVSPLKYGLKEVIALNPVSYKWKKHPNTDKQVGLIAQEVRKVIPEIVIGDEKKEDLGINYIELIPVLINAIKEQQKQIDDLKDKGVKPHNINQQDLQFKL